MDRAKVFNLFCERNIPTYSDVLISKSIYNASKGLQVKYKKSHVHVAVIENIK